MKQIIMATLSILIGGAITFIATTAVLAIMAILPIIILLGTMMISVFMSWLGLKFVVALRSAKDAEPETEKTSQSLH